MAEFHIRPLQSSDAAWVNRLVAEQWGADFVVAHGAIYYPRDLPGFAAYAGSERIGLVTYRVEGDACEIVTLDSLRPGLGVGTALIEAVKTAAQARRCRRLWLITTNDNLNALRFYQKRGFVLVAVHRNAVEEARQYKAIPPIGSDGIPIRDEIELEMIL